MLKRLLLLTAAMALAGAVSATARTVLDGVWGGGQSILTVRHDGWSLEMGCAHGVVTGPVSLDASGRFRAKGVFQSARAGPQLADDAAGGAPATFFGQVRGDTMHLEVRSRAGVQTYTLKRGVRPKLVRCL